MYLQLNLMIMQLHLMKVVDILTLKSIINDGLVSLGTEGENLNFPNPGSPQPAMKRACIRTWPETRRVFVNVGLIQKDITIESEYRTNEYAILEVKFGKVLKSSISLRAGRMKRNVVGSS